MFLILVSIVFSALFISSDGLNNNNSPSFFTLSDSAKIEVYVNNDSQGLLENYLGKVYTPVCEGDKCYAIEIDIYWDCIGRFHHYDTIAGKGLTKLDHIPFTESDYLKLREILNLSNSVLASYTKEELVGDTRSSDIDGITGATVNEIKQAVIEGAVYSCYTLWHIVHGPVKDSLRKETIRLFNRNFIKKLVGREDQEINYFLINSFSENDFKAYLPEVLEMIHDGKGYFAKNALEILPDNVLSENQTQEFFAGHFAVLDYFSQVALLERLDTNFLIESLRLTLSENIDSRNSYKNELIQQLLNE